MFKGHRSFSGAIYKPGFLSTEDKATILDELLLYKPIWELRYSKNNPAPEGQDNRSLLRPVYWLGSWQFACLNYYHPPKGIEYRCVEAEPFPPTMQKIVDHIQDLVRSSYPAKDIPRDWQLNTCLINYYGSVLKEGKWQDVARVGEHRDYEPGPVASISFGDRAFFQFVKTLGRGSQSQAVQNFWLEDSSLQVFGGDRYKKHLFHRVQRVEKKSDTGLLQFDMPDFKTRRLNLTFRYVPKEHIYKIKHLPRPQLEDIQPYLQMLQKTSSFWNS